MYLYHLTRGSPFTEMARFVFGGDPRRLSEMNSIFIEFGYNTFFNKISGTSLEQWIPSHLDVCRQLIYDALASGGIEEVEFEDGQVVDRRWILHHFQFESFRVFGFLDDLPCPPHAQEVQLIGGICMRVMFSGHSILDTCAAMA